MILCLKVYDPPAPAVLNDNNLHIGSFETRYLKVLMEVLKHNLKQDTGKCTICLHRQF